MNNLITVSIEFYFKGEKISASIDLDLEPLIQYEKELPDFYPLLASSINLNVYSYEYEMMQTAPLSFQSSNDLVNQFIHEKQFNFQDYKNEWGKNEYSKVIAKIMQDHLSEKERQNPKIKKALLSAFNAGRKNNTPL